MTSGQLHKTYTTIVDSTTIGAREVDIKVTTDLGGHHMRPYVFEQRIH